MTEDQVTELLTQYKDELDKYLRTKKRFSNADLKLVVRSNDCYDWLKGR